MCSRSVYNTEILFVAMVNLIVKHADVPGQPVKRPSVWIPHSITSPVEVIIVERVHSRICTQDVDSGG